jgi:hypothetical protein
VSDIRVGDSIRLSTYEGHVGFGTPESRSVYKTHHEGKVLDISQSQRFGQSVRLDCSIAHDDPDDDTIIYLNDFEGTLINVAVCTHCDGRGHVDAPTPDPVATARKATEAAALAAAARISEKNSAA